MPKTLTFTAYSYDELTEDGKEKALERLHDINVDFGDWHEWIFDDWQEKLQKMGFEDITISYTGFWSQGDGASFTCKKFNALAWLKYHKVCNEFRTMVACLQNHSRGYSLAEILGCIDRSNHHYYHEKSTSFSIEAYYYGENAKVRDRFDDQIDQLERWVNSEIVSLGRQIYQDLEKYYEEDTSREQVENTIRINDYLFFADGNMISHPTVMSEMDEAKV